jgi:hypothetical protein
MLYGHLFEVGSSSSQWNFRNELKLIGISPAYEYAVDTGLLFIYLLLKCGHWTDIPGQSN